MSNTLACLTGMTVALVTVGCGPLTEAKEEPASTNIAPLSPILLNKCTGESWMLIKVLIKEADPTKDQKQLFTWRWAPISKEYQEPQLSPG